MISPDKMISSDSGKTDSEKKNRHTLNQENAGSELIFDLTKQSRSMKIFNQFLRKRKAALEEQTAVPN